MARRRYKLRNLDVDRVDLVDAGANQFADIVIVKSDDARENIKAALIAKNKDKGYPTDNQLKNGPPPVKQTSIKEAMEAKDKKKKKGAKGSAFPERNAAESSTSAGTPPPAEPVAKHTPGGHDHDQSSHGGGRGGGPVGRASERQIQRGGPGSFWEPGQEFNPPPRSQQDRDSKAYFTANPDKLPTGGFARPGGGVPADEGRQSGFLEERLLGEFTTKPAFRAENAYNPDLRIGPTAPSKASYDAVQRQFPNDSRRQIMERIDERRNERAQFHRDRERNVGPKRPNLGEQFAAWQRRGEPGGEFFKEFPGHEDDDKDKDKAGPPKGVGSKPPTAGAPPPGKPAVPPTAPGGTPPTPPSNAPASPKGPPSDGEGLAIDPNGPGPAMGPGSAPGKRPTQTPDPKAVDPKKKNKVPGKGSATDDKRPQLADVLRNRGKTPSAPQKPNSL